MDAFVSWLQSTSLSQAIVFQIWIWPAAEVVHFIGLALVIGIVGLLDLRLIGFFRGVGIAALRELVPYALMGFGLNVLSGLIFLVGHPEQLVHNRAWWFKVAALGIAGANAGAFELTLAKRTLALGPNDPTPVAVKVIGILSILAWFAVLYWGRMLPFAGDAF